MTFKLSTEEFEVLRTVIGKRNPPLLKQIHSMVGSEYSYKQKEQIKNLLADELVENGLRSDDEPTEYGEVLERISDKFLLDA